LGRGASPGGRRARGSGPGPPGSANAGMSSAKAGANPARRKPQGSGGRIVRSGLVGPKARPRGVVEGGARWRVRHCRRPGNGQGRGVARGAGRWWCPCRRAPATRRGRRGGRGRPSEKSWTGRPAATVPKPPQVGEARSLRRAGDLSLRNSANCPRNFGRRGPGGGDFAGRSTAAQATVYHKHRSLRSRKTPYRG
jgi:hypothetical protein